MAAGWSAPAHWLLREITVLAHLLTVGDDAGWAPPRFAAAASWRAAGADR